MKYFRLIGQVCFVAMFLLMSCVSETQGSGGEGGSVVYAKDPHPTQGPQAA
jgi:hypothetical protein